MSKRNRNRNKGKETLTVAEPDQKMQAFTFGEPSAVLDRREILDYTECVGNGKWIEPPISFSGLAKSLRAAVHHSSPIYVKRNILASTYITHPLLSQQDFSRFVLDYLVFGNAFLEKRQSVSGKLLKLETSPAKYTRRGVEPGVYWFVQSFAEPHPFAPDSVFHLLEPDINQELYGMPEYLSALNSAWLNESATLFRRKYYQNGAHAGYIMYVTDAAQNSTDVESLRSAMNSSKGMGNFKNLFFYAPNGKPDGIKIVPLSEVATKDDFFNIKKVSAADLLDAHRIPYQLMGGKPENVGSVGDVVKAAMVFVRNELTPLQQRITEVNDWIGEEVIRFKKYTLDNDDE
ncbi:phage portal protein, PBSX family [Serratia proteamaculans]|uniref:phage portal protein n=1 Tax=Serratia proteamaculans TaxID=28151 RepID=UPI00124A0018|nr:phage portal protein [Serratia proteamaculans]KAB1496357.1 phage portal protein [Serratia proteamaculans]CAI0969674.1 phage portal protein, PBSX family [Serratia proteamaculans]CAI0973324.1 phage portal protein, PBSX family [Serratia proteamaculans]